MRVLSVICVLCLICTACIHLPSHRPLCKEEILSQYATFVNAGYETEIIHLKNKNPDQTYGFKYHVAIRVKHNNEWYWIEQPSYSFVLTTQQPPNTKILRKLEFEEVINWVKSK